MTNPTIAAAIAINNTAPAAKSFVRLIASLYSGETKSARASMDELTASAANTAPITIVTAIHSMRESPNTHPGYKYANCRETMDPSVMLLRDQ